MQLKALDSGFIAGSACLTRQSSSRSWGKGQRLTVKAASLLVISLMLKVDSLQGSVTTYIVSSTVRPP